MKILRYFKKHLNPKERKAPTIQQIAVFGYADCDETYKVCKDATEVSKVLAQAGYTIINGGGPGVMRASTVGAKLGGGKAVGVTFYPKDMTNFEGRDKRNEIDQEIKTDSYVERTLRLLKEGQIYVIFNGGTGTISEFGMAWGLARLYFGHHKPLILYGKFWKNVISAFRKNMLIRPEELRVFKIVHSPEGVLKAIKEFEKEIYEGRHSHLKTTKGDFSL